MRCRRISTSFIVAAVLALAAPAFAANRPYEAPVDAQRAYASVRAPLARTRSGVPVLVPGTLPRAESRVTAELRRADRHGYEIELVTARGCEGATACHAGSITGTRSDRTPIPGRPVRLPLGVTGRLVEGRCGAYCADSTITFDWHGSRYVFADKRGVPQELTSHIIRLR